MNDVQPGEAIDDSFGFGFAVSEKIVLSTQVSGGCQRDSDFPDENLIRPANGDFTVCLRWILGAIFPRQSSKPSQCG
jgi:hypothetical protein